MSKEKEEDIINDWWVDDDGPAGTITPNSDDPMSALLPMVAIMSIAGGLGGAINWSIVGVMVTLAIGARLAKRQTPALAR